MYGHVWTVYLYLNSSLIFWTYSVYHIDMYRDIIGFLYVYIHTEKYAGIDNYRPMGYLDHRYPHVDRFWSECRCRVRWFQQLLGHKSSLNPFLSTVLVGGG